MQITSIFTPMGGCYEVPKQDVLSRLSRFLYNRPIVLDRFNFLNQFSAYNFLGMEDFPSPLSTYTHNQFADICHSVAFDLISKAKAEHNTISVAWSGGVDSTCIIASLTTAGIHRDNLVILHTDDARTENPAFFSWLIDNSYTLKNITDISVIQDAVTSGYLVTGCCADSLFEEVSHYKFSYLWDLDFKDALCMKDMSNDVPIIESMSQYYSVPIKTFQNLYYLISFCCHFGTDAIVFPTYIGSRNNIIRFFDDQQFQRWSLARYLDHTYNSNINNNQYKREMKDIIVNLTHNKDLYNQGKGFSRKKLSSVVNRCWLSYITDSNDFVYNNDTFTITNVKGIVAREFRKFLK